MEIFGLHPRRGFSRVAVGVVGLVAQLDAAFQPIRLLAVGAEQRLDVGAAIDARYEQFFRLAFGEQRQPVLDALAAAGQNDNGVGAGGIGGSVAWHQTEEPDKACKPCHDDSGNGNRQPMLAQLHGMRASARCTVASAVKYEIVAAAIGSSTNRAHCQSCNTIEGTRRRLGPNTEACSAAWPSSNRVMTASAQPIRPPRQPRPSACRANCRAI